MRRTATLIAKSVSLSLVFFLSHISDVLGRDKMIVCPFHTDIVRSLSISHEKGLWHCFGCGKGGDVIALVMEMEGLDYPEQGLCICAVGFVIFAIRRG